MDAVDVLREELIFLGGCVVHRSVRSKRITKVFTLRPCNAKNIINRHQLHRINDRIN
jgi:hypothetical protein